MSVVIFMMYPMVVGHSIPRLSDSRKTHACLSQARRWLCWLWNLMFPRVRLLSMLQPMHTFDWFLVKMRVGDTVKNF